MHRKQKAQKSRFLGGKSFVIELGNELGFQPYSEREPIIKRITNAGGKVVTIVDETVTAVISRRVTATEYNSSLPLQHAIRSNVPIVNLRFLAACENESRMVGVAPYLICLPSDSTDLRAIVEEQAPIWKKLPPNIPPDLAPKTLGKALERKTLQDMLHKNAGSVSPQKILASAHHLSEKREEFQDYCFGSVGPHETDPPFFPAEYSIARSHLWTSPSGAGAKVELHVATGSTPASDDNKESGTSAAFLIEKRSANAEGSELKPKFRVFYMTIGGTIGQKTCALFEPSSPIIAEALYSRVYNTLVQCFGTPKMYPHHPTLGSPLALSKAKTQAFLCTPNCALDPAVSSIVSDLYSDAWSLLQRRTSIPIVTAAKGAFSSLSLMDMTKAEAVLVQISEVLMEMHQHPDADGEKVHQQKQLLDKLSKDFYKIVPTPSGGSSPMTIQSFEEAEDAVMLLRGMLHVGECSGGNVYTAPVQVQYGALGAELSLLNTTQQDQISKFLIESFGTTEMQLFGTSVGKDLGVAVAKIFSVHRDSDHKAFNSGKGKNLHNHRLLFHGTSAGNLVSILGAGLKVPRNARFRRDKGMLGRGIYFGDTLTTALRYVSPSSSRSGSVFVIVAEVALGHVDHVHYHQYGIEAPSSGYDSVHGVRSVDGSTDFQDDEYVIYDASQQRIRYIIEFQIDREGPVALAAKMGSMPAMINKPNQVSTTLLGDPTNVVQVQEMTTAPKVKEVTPGLQSASGETPVPLLNTRVKGKIIDMIGEVAIFQEYYNADSKAIEAKYVFPLQRGAAVCGFEAYINHKKVVGKVKEKEQARKEYKAAVEAGHGAYLMDEAEETPDVFTVSVGNLPPKTRVVIRIQYIIELTVDASKDAVAFVIPSSVHPMIRDKQLKEVTQSTTDTVASYGVQGGTVGGAARVELGFDMPFDIVAIECTHPVERKRTACRATIKAANVDFDKNGDFTVFVRLTVMNSPRIWIENSEELQSRAAMITFFPKIDTRFSATSNDSAHEVLIVLDASASMSEGSAAEDAKIASLMLIDRLPDHWLFNVVLFGSYSHHIFPEMIVSDSEGKRKAKSFIHSFYGASLGGTDCMSVLEECSLLCTSTRQVEVFLFSDGLVPHGEEPSTFRLLRSSPSLRIFSIACGSGAAQATMLALARHGRGQTVTLSHDVKSRWIGSIEKQLHRSGQPSLTDITMEWSTEQSKRLRDATNTTVTQSPKSIPCLFSGENTVVYGIVKHQARQCELVARHTGMGIERDQYGDWPEQRYLVTVHGLSFRTGQLIHRLAAKARIRDYTEGTLVSQEAGTEENADVAHNEAMKAALKQAVIDLGCKYCLVTPFTSMVAVEERSADEQELLKKVKAGECSTPAVDELAGRFDEQVDPIPEASYLEEHLPWDILPPVEIVEEEERHIFITDEEVEIEASEVSSGVGGFQGEVESSSEEEDPCESESRSSSSRGSAVRNVANRAPEAFAHKSKPRAASVDEDDSDRFNYDDDEGDYCHDDEVELMEELEQEQEEEAKEMVQVAKLFSAGRQALSLREEKCMMMDEIREVLDEPIMQEAAAALPAPPREEVSLQLLAKADMVMSRSLDEKSSLKKKSKKIRDEEELRRDDFAGAPAPCEAPSVPTSFAMPQQYQQMQQQPMPAPKPFLPLKSVPMAAASSGPPPSASLMFQAKSVPMASVSSSIRDALPSAPMMFGSAPPPPQQQQLPPPPPPSALAPSPGGPPPPPPCYASSRASVSSSSSFSAGRPAPSGGAAGGGFLAKAKKLAAPAAARSLASKEKECLERKMEAEVQKEYAEESMKKCAEEQQVRCRRMKESKPSKVMMDGLFDAAPEVVNAPVSLGYAHSQYDVFYPVISKNASHAVKTQPVMLPYSGCCYLELDILAGDSIHGVEHNIKLGHITLALPSGFKEQGDTVADITFSLKANGELSVTLTCRLDVFYPDLKASEKHEPIASSWMTDLAFEMKNGCLIPARVRENEARSAAEQERTQTVATLRGLSTNDNDQSVRAAFDKAFGGGAIRRVKLTYCTSTGLCLDSGEVQFSSQSEMIRCLKLCRLKLPSCWKLVPLHIPHLEEVDNVMPFYAEVQPRLLPALTGNDTAAAFGVFRVISDACGTVAKYFTKDVPAAEIGRIVLALIANDCHQRLREAGITARNMCADIHPTFDPSSTTSDLVRRVLLRFSTLSDGSMLFPFDVRIAGSIEPPTADGTIVVQKFDPEFNYSESLKRTSLSILDVYESHRQFKSW